MTSKIIKGKGPKGSARSSGRSVGIISEKGGVVHKRVMDAEAKADKILSDANKDADQIRKEADGVLADAKKRAEEAVKKGFADGESKGLAKVTEKLVDFEHLKERFFENAEPEVIKLSMDIAEKIIGQLASESSELTKNVVRHALERTLGDRIVVKLNPDDYKSIMEDEKGFKDVLDRTKRLSFRADDSITKGGCIVESEVGTIDARLELQLKAIRKALEI